MRQRGVGLVQIICAAEVLEPLHRHRGIEAVHFGRLDQRQDLSTGPPLNPQQNPELPAQFHLVEHGLIPAPGHIFLSKAPRRLPEIVSAEERSRTWDAHQVNEAELIVLPMDWLSKKQSGRVMPTAMGLGMANLTMDCETLKEHRCAGSCSGWCQFLHGLVARQYALREVHSQACRIRPCNALSFTLSVVVLLPTPQLGLDGRRQNSRHAPL